jgi:hypothetical protein
MTNTSATDMILGEWSAINRAAGLAGSIHDDATARKLGFRGGFVGGVTLVGYACEGWRRYQGLSLALRPFMVSVDLRAPVYEGEVARVRATETGSRLAWRIETDSSGVTTEGALDVLSNALPPDAPASDLPVLDGIDLGNIEARERIFSRAETAAYYKDVLHTDVPDEGDLPVSIAMWSNPMTPVIERLSATHTTVHRTSEMFVERLPIAGAPYIFAISVPGVTPRGPGKALVHVHCDVIDGDGNRLAVIQHRSAVRKRD